MLSCASLRRISMPARIHARAPPLDQGARCAGLAGPALAARCGASSMTSRRQATVDRAVRRSSRGCRREAGMIDAAVAHISPDALVLIDFSGFNLRLSPASSGSACRRLLHQSRRSLRVLAEAAQRERAASSPRVPVIFPFEEVHLPRGRVPVEFRRASAGRSHRAPRFARRVPLAARSARTRAASRGDPAGSRRAMSPRHLPDLVASAAESARRCRRRVRRRARIASGRRSSTWARWRYLDQKGNRARALTAPTTARCGGRRAHGVGHRDVRRAADTPDLIVLSRPRGLSYRLLPASSRGAIGW